LHHRGGRLPSDLFRSQGHAGADSIGGVYLYSLYDALVSINVPNDKARAVVDAMERDMTTTIATKTDLQLLELKMTAALDKVTVRLGSLIVIVAGLFAALKLT
jgi:hypothetical protein